MVRLAALAYMAAASALFVVAVLRAAHDDPGYDIRWIITLWLVSLLPGVWVFR